MTPNSSSTKTAAIASLATAFLVSSCSLPPREAWRQIQQQGLIAFLDHTSTAPSQNVVAPSCKPSAPQIAAANTTPAPISAPVIAPKIPAIKPTPAPAPVVAEKKQSNPGFVGTAPAKQTPAPASPVVTPTHSVVPASEKPLVAKAVPSLPGFVRSPYTNPPRLVDVKGATPGSTMVCPYTQRPFVVPDDFVNATPTTIASNHVNLDHPPTVAVKTQPLSQTPAGSLFSNNNKPAAKTNATPKSNAIVAATPTKAAAPEIPYGAPIPGRPGFVNSPFAGKNQLVDVTGLPVGMEVKCPYTGKLFRVPAQDVAEQKPVSNLAAPGSINAPEKK